MSLLSQKIWCKYHSVFCLIFIPFIHVIILCFFNNWAWSNQRSPYRRRGAFWKQHERDPMWGQMLALGILGSTWQGMQATSRKQERSMTDDHQGGRDLSPTTPRNWILPLTWMNLQVGCLPKPPEMNPHRLPPLSVLYDPEQRTQVSPAWASDLQNYELWNQFCLTLWS